MGARLCGGIISSKNGVVAPSLNASKRNPILLLPDKC